jgi:glycosyltransferase 2 family protein
MDGTMSPTLRTWARLAGGAAILGVLVWKVGSGPFLTGLQRVDAPSVTLALALAAVSTTCNGARWVLVARELDVPLSLRAAVAACYRSQLLNSVLPGGVLGDVHRGLRHGSDTGARSASLRAVLWERVLGQLVLVEVAAVVLVAVPSPLPGWVAVLVGSAAAALVVVAVTPARRSLPRDLRLLLTSRSLPGIVLASVGAVSCYVATFAVAARAVEVTTSAGTLVALALLALMAMSLPVNVAGWGPREGTTAWAFAAVGLGAADGVSTAVVYGVLGLVATLPGLAVLLLDRRRVPDPRPSLAEVAHG